MDMKHFKIADTLKSGMPVIIRAVQPSDKELIREAFQNLEPRTIYTRFFQHKTQLTDEELRATTEIDYERDVGLLVTMQDDDREVVIGGVRFWALTDATGDSRRAEIAFTVEEDYQGQGMASRLLKHLARVAREMNITSFEAEVLPENKSMIMVFERSGLPCTKRYEDGMVHVSMSLQADN